MATRADLARLVVRDTGVTYEDADFWVGQVFKAAGEIVAREKPVVSNFGTFEPVIGEASIPDRRGDASFRPDGPRPLVRRRTARIRFKAADLLRASALAADEKR